MPTRRRARASSCSSRRPGPSPACGCAENAMGEAMLRGRTRAATPAMPAETAAQRVDIVRTFPDTTWGDDGPTRGVETLVEDGLVLAFPHLPFELSADERRFLDPRWGDGQAKNISVRWPSGQL